MKSKPRRQQRAEREALQWIMRSGQGHAARPAREGFNAWLVSSPYNRPAYEYMEKLWQATGLLEEMKDVEPLNSPADLDVRALARERAREREPRPANARFGWRFAVPVAVAAAVLMFVAGTPDGPDRTSYATKRAQLGDLRLADGTRVDLSPETKLIVAYSPETRRVELEQGEALFSVEREPSRPFVVVAGEQRVRAVGTRFTVHRGPRGTTVSVFEGLVVIEGSSPGARPELARLAAGDSILLSANRVADRDKVTVSELRAPWLDGYLEFQDERLDRVIFDANRFGTGSIILADPALAEIRVTAVFKSGDLEKLARNLALIIPVDVSHGENGQIILKKRS